jgi:hypothetical protein
MDQRGQGQDPHSEQGLVRDGRGGAMGEHTKESGLRRWVPRESSRVVL